MNDKAHSHSEIHNHATHLTQGNHIHGPSSSADTEKPFTDPVCKMKVGADPQKEIVHGGQAYHFCSAKCMDKFRANPAAYLTPEPAGAATEAPPGTIYTCPMRPEIRRTEPGNCPICGMALDFLYAFPRAVYSEKRRKLCC